MHLQVNNTLRLQATKGLGPHQGKATFPLLFVAELELGCPSPPGKHFYGGEGSEAPLTSQTGGWNCSLNPTVVEVFCSVKYESCFLIQH